MADLPFYESVLIQQPRRTRSFTKAVICRFPSCFFVFFVVIRTARSSIVCVLRKIHVILSERKRGS